VRSKADRAPLLSAEEAIFQANGFMTQFPVLYPNEEVFRFALHGMTAFRIPWFDAHLWGYAMHYGLSEIVSEDFQHGGHYGRVRVTNPFVAFGLA